jgi:acetyl esterase/lipase
MGAAHHLMILRPTSSPWRAARALLTFAAAMLASLGAAEAGNLPAGVRLLTEVPYLPAGRAETLDIYLPAVGGGPRPAVVYFHGGGWVRGDKAADRERNLGGHFAAAGFVFVSVNYVLGPGVWPRNLHDCRNAVRFIRAHATDYGVDPARIAAMGASAGGHLALMAAYTAEQGPAEFAPAGPYAGVSDRVAAVVNFYGMTNLLTRRVAESDGTPTGRTMDSHAPEVLGVDRVAGVERWRLASPVTHVAKTSPPTLIVHGLSDPTVDYLQAVELANVLRARDVPHELLLLEGIGHMFHFDAWQDRPMPAHVRPAVFAFLAKHLDIPPLSGTR